jgi:hypothetical protein
VAGHQRKNDPVVFNSDLAVNKEGYITKCLPVNDKFIQKYHQKDKVVFWTDLASDLYAKDTLVNLQKRKIECVPEALNLPKVPQLRLIKIFWAILTPSQNTEKFDRQDQKSIKNY